MYVTYPMAAEKFGCSTATIRRRVKEMEESGLYPTGVRRVKGVEVDLEQLEDFCTVGRRKNHGIEEESDAVRNRDSIVAFNDRRNSRRI